MNEYYKYTPVKVNLAPSITYTAIGVLMLIMFFYITVSRMRRGI